jgi:hypothetical protein
MSNTWGPDGDNDDELVDRLAAFGRQPVPPAAQGRHLLAIAAVDHQRRQPIWRRHARRAGAIAILGAGALVATTGLAAAGALGPLQPVVAKGIEAATPLKVPKGPAEEKARNEVKTAPAGVHGTTRVTEGCVAATNGEFAINHGQYLKQEKAKGAEAYAAAKASDCGKPVASETDDTSTDPAATTDTDSNTGTKTTEGTPNTGGSPTADEHRVPKCTDDTTTTPPSEPGKPECTPGGPATTTTVDGKTNNGKSGTNGGKAGGGSGPPSTKAPKQK